MVLTALNAKRWAGVPIRQPAYSFREIPKCERDLKGSRVHEITDRSHLVDAMGEIVLLCNEAMRRSAQQRSLKKSSKPLSLEYIADRLDVDDPIWGYMVRDEASSRLQGFITCTTFTNWQKSFRWDSMHDSALAYDDEELTRDIFEGKRRYDEDGKLAAELNATVRYGDVWNEGILYPRIAEISLLGGLGCGRALVSLALERLESMKPTSKYNYDFVALQATENSISFYESMGFMRVGCITEDDNFEEKKRSQRNETEEQGSTTESEDEDEETALDSIVPTAEDSCPTDGSSGQTECTEDRSEVVSSPVVEYEVEKPWESPLEIAKKMGVDVWDIKFLNHFLYPNLNSRSFLKRKTKIFIPKVQAAKYTSSNARSKKDIDENAGIPSWYVARENDTPKMIAKKFGVTPKSLVQANLNRLPDLQALSRLRGGTRIKVSHFHLDDDRFVPYCHWTFPDDSFEENEPSYMMVRRLDRKPKSGAARQVEATLAVKVEKYCRPPSTIYVTGKAPARIKSAGSNRQRSESVMVKPKKPKRPESSFLLFCDEQRPVIWRTMDRSDASECSKALSNKWKQMTEAEKAPYTQRHEQEKKSYQNACETYERDFAAYQEARSDKDCTGDKDGGQESGTLFNMVVKLTKSYVTKDFSDFEYYYVLTYIPDLQWCHLAPMRKVGYWGSDRPDCEGRPMWMLVEENQGKEVDISARFCIPLFSKAVHQTEDADKEQWDIPDSGPTRDVLPACSSVSVDASSVASRSIALDVPRHAWAATKPLTGTVERKRKRSQVSTEDQTIQPPSTKKRGRPSEQSTATHPERKSSPLSQDSKRDVEQPTNNSQPEEVPPKRSQSRPRKRPLPSDAQGPSRGPSQSREPSPVPQFSLAHNGSPVECDESAEVTPIVDDASLAADHQRSLPLLRGASQDSPAPKVVPPSLSGMTRFKAVGGGMPPPSKSQSESVLPGRKSTPRRSLKDPFRRLTNGGELDEEKGPPEVESLASPAMPRRKASPASFRGVSPSSSCIEKSDVMKQKDLTSSPCEHTVVLEPSTIRFPDNGPMSERTGEENDTEALDLDTPMPRIMAAPRSLEDGLDDDGRDLLPTQVSVYNDKHDRDLEPLAVEGNAQQQPSIARVLPRRKAAPVSLKESFPALPRQSRIVFNKPRQLKSSSPDSDQKEVRPKPLLSGHPDNPSGDDNTTLLAKMGKRVYRVKLVSKGP